MDTHMGMSSLCSLRLRSHQLQSHLNPPSLWGSDHFGQHSPVLSLPGLNPFYSGGEGRPLSFPLEWLHSQEWVRGG